MKFSYEIDEMATEFHLANESVKALTNLLKREHLAEDVIALIKRIKASRELERDHLEILMQDYFLYVPITEILEEEQCELKPLR